MDLRFRERLASSIRRKMMYLLTPVCPVLCSKYLYRNSFGRRLDLKHPVTLNEKNIWLKLNTYRDSKLVSQCADKLGVRDYVRRLGCGEILNELYAVWESAEEIRWEELPESFVLKFNDASGFNLLVPDKSRADWPAIQKQLKKWARRDFWRYYAELQYRGIPKRILCERYIESKSGLLDYKIYCFHGQPKYILVCVGRENGAPAFYFFDDEWNFCPITKDGKKEPAGFTLPRPEGLERMLDYARRLSEPFPYVRVDLYDAEGKILFGEMTFTPSAGMDTDRLPETDLMLGQMLKLPFEQEEQNS